MAGRGIVIKIEGDGESAKRALEMVRDQLQKTGEQGSHSAQLLSESMERIKHSLEYVGIYMGLREAIDGLKEMVKGSVELGVELGHLHQQTGISAENLSVLKFMADSTGVSFEVLTKGFKKFSTDIRDADEGSKKAVETFARLGISQATVKKNSGDMYEMLGLVADRFQKMPDGPLKSAAANDLFGRSGQQLIPILNQGRAGIAEFKAEAEALGIVLDDAGVAKLEAIHMSLVKVEGAARGAGLGITEGLEPAVTGLADALSHATQKGEGFETIGERIGKVAIVTSAFVSDLVGTVRELVAVGEVIAAQAKFAANTASSFHIGLGGVTWKVDTTQVDAALKHMHDVNDETNAFHNKAQEMFDGDFFDPSVDLGGGHMGTKRHKAIATGDNPPTTIPGGAKAKSMDNVARAAEALAAEQAKAAADAQKAFDQAELAALEAHHKELLVSDREFYAQKLALQLDQVDTEHAGLQTKYEQLAHLQATQHGDKTLKHDKNGNSAEELNTQREMVAVLDQMTALEAKRNALQAAYGAEVATGAAGAELANLRAAADLEKARNAGTEAQIALIRKEHELAAQKVAREGGSGEAAGQIRALGEIEAKKVEIEEINRKITATEQDTKLAVEQLADAANKDPRLKKAAAEQINKLNAEEAKQLRDLVAAYDALAQELGGEFLLKAKALHAEIDKLNTPNKKSDAKFGEDLAHGAESMAERMASAAEKGKNSFKDMARSIEEELTQLAIKLAFEKWLTPLIAGAVGGKSGLTADGGTLPGYAEGGDDPGGPQIVGEKGPELWNPKGPGTVTPNNMLQKLADTGGGGGGRAPNVTTNIVNQTSTPVSAQPSEVSYNSQLHELIVHTILTDAAQNGPIAQMNQGSG